MVRGLITLQNFGNMGNYKIKKFSHNQAIYDTFGMTDINSYIDVKKVAVSFLKSLQEAIRKKRMAPLPKSLECSMFDPEMLMIRSDEEFVEIYEYDLKDTVEELVARTMIYLIRYECFTGFNLDCIVRNIYERTEPKMVLDKLDRDLTELIKETEKLFDDCMDSEAMSVIYSHMVLFAKMLKFDLNLFIEWRCRYYRHIKSKK